MARMALKARLEALERQRSDKQSPNRILYYNPTDRSDHAATNANLLVWQAGYWRQGGNPNSGPLRAFVGRFLLVPDFGDDAAFEAAMEKQQRELLNVACSKH